MKNTPLSRRAFVAASIHSTAALAWSSLTVASVPAGMIRLQVKQARAVVVDAKGLVTVAADRRLLFVSLDGAEQRSLDTPRPVRALCHDANGRLWITLGDQVARLNDEGEIEAVGAGLGRESALTGIAVADDGRIFVADSSLRVIWRLDAAGNILGQIKAGEKGFAVPRAFFPIAWQDGQLVVAEPGRHQVQRFTAEGEKVSSWGERTRDESGFGGCCNPVSVTTLANGGVITVERGLARVKRFDRDGNFHATLAGPESFAPSAATEDAGDLFGCEGGLFDVAAAPNGSVVVLDRTACELHVLS